LYAGPKYLDKLKPEPGPNRKARLDLQLCTMSKVSFSEFYLDNDAKLNVRLNQNVQWWIGKKFTKFHLQHEKNVQQNWVWCICKANVSHLNVNTAALWVWLNSSKSYDLRTDAFSTSTKCKS